MAKKIEAKGNIEANRFDSKRFKKLKDGWIKDNLLGIDWAPSSLEKELSWNEGMEYAKQFGRLPSDFELSTLIDRSKYNPAIIDAAKVLELRTSWYWSGTPTAWYSGGAWVVYFSGGGVYGSGEGSRGYVRPVRASK